MASITVFEAKPWEQRYLAKRLKGNKISFIDGPLDERTAKAAKDAQIISVFIYSQIGKDILAKLPKLKLITTRSTGFDHIDTAECKARGIKVCNVPQYGSNTVAEHTFALILSLSRNVHKSYVRASKNDFSIEGLTGFDLKDKTLGIIGGGNIGMHVARIGRGFGMHVRVFDVRQDDFMAELIGFRYLPMDELLAAADIITLHVPENRHTHHLINKKTISKMKRCAILINTSRGGIVDTDALLYALEHNMIGGAGLDVIEGEELIKEERQLLHEGQNVDKWRIVVRDQKILGMDNVVFTPHNAFNSREALMRILDTTVQNIECCMDRKDNANIVNL